jgi:formylglycine-generating enzyme required for sulfatase activity
MRKKSFGFLLLIGIFILILSSCNVPFQSQIISEEEPTADTSSAEMPEEESGAAVEPELEPPHNVDGAELTLIPAATFQMGSAATDSLADADEFPQHQVTEDEFYIYTYEVTNQMYAACVDAGACLTPRTLDEGPTSHYEHPDYADYPVVGVDWVMARDYCTWAGARLPTEAEWELVSRGPDSLYYPWGEEDPTCDYVNMKGCYKPNDTQEVGYYLLGNSPYEVWDMSGNVWEWVHDWYGEEYYSTSPEDNPIGPLEPDDPDIPLRVVRGGGLNSHPEMMRSASRIGLNPYRSFIDVGFRCVVGEELLFPAAYDHGDDRHEDVPPDSADDGDGPDGDGGTRSIRLLPGCRTSEIADLGVFFDPAEPALNDASTDTGILVCDPVPPPEGTYYCYDLPGSPGDTINLHFHFSDGSSMDALVEYPPCDTPFWISDFCEVDETGANVGHLVLHYPPGGPGLVGAAATAAPDPAVDLDCVETAPGTAVCSGLPGTPGASMLGIFAEFDDGSTKLGEHLNPWCPDTVGFIPSWDLILSCIPHADGSGEFRALIDTNMAGADFIEGSWTFTGVPIIPEPKSCSLEDHDLNIWSCMFPIGVYGDIEFCADWVGGSNCESYDVSTILPGDCSRPPSDEDVMGYCRPGQVAGSCSGPCMLTCPVGVNCNTCTMP